MDKSTEQAADGLREEAAVVLEQLIRQLATEQDLELQSCVWNLGQGFGNNGSHRLDLFFEHTAFKAYFTDAELIEYGVHRQSKETESRLRCLLAERHDQAWPIPLASVLN